MTIAQMHGNSELFRAPENPEISYNTVDEVSRVLNRDLDMIDFENVWDDWRAFAENPSKYEGTVVVEMVNQYLDEIEEIGRAYREQQHLEEGSIEDRLV